MRSSFEILSQSVGAMIELLHPFTFTISSMPVCVVSFVQHSQQPSQPPTVAPGASLPSNLPSFFLSIASTDAATPLPCAYVDFDEVEDHEFLASFSAKIQGMSNVHAIYITIMSVYFVFFSELFSEDHAKGLITFRNSNLSTFTLGVSVGYFSSDLAMIFWLYPSLGGLEYVVHHILSLCAISYAMLTGEGQLYTYMVMISETTTPGINLRWYLDTAGMKRSNAYLVNGVIMFVAWLGQDQQVSVMGLRLLPEERLEVEKMAVVEDTWSMNRDCLGGVAR
ncbi:hypothetical protein KSP40_PGU019729 [Platanthera guangdongensis]|uniref:TLC domain-containing protein n=1 Tax=Platanthera guangdongensis TaxID=2320717 RepID=A0ABR2M6D8_9ASPA